MKFNFKSSILKRISWVVFFLFIYVLGGKLSLPFVDIEKNFYLGSATDTFQLASALTGGNLRTISFLSIGLSPWMSAMLLSKMFSQIRQTESKVSQNVSDRRMMYLTIAIAIIQSIAIVLNLPFQSDVNLLLARITGVCVLTAGAVFLVWLSDMNAVFGIGGPTPILMFGMLIYLPIDLYKTITKLGLDYFWILAIFCLSLIFLYIAVRVEYAKYRIPINKLSIHNDFKNYSYLDVKLNISGGMAIMYTMTFTIIPQYLLLLLRYFYPDQVWISEMMSALQMGKMGWFLVYIGVLALLTYSFAFINFSPEEIATKMKKSGEYIYGIYPGKSTEHYLRQLVTQFAFIGTVYTVIMVGLPLSLALVNIEYISLAMAPGLFLIFVGLSFTISNELRAIHLNESYRKLF